VFGDQAEPKPKGELTALPQLRVKGAALQQGRKDREGTKER